MKTTLTLAAILTAFLLVSCGLLSPAQQAASLAAIDQLRASGAITQEQWESMRDAILDVGMWSWLEEAATALTGAALAYVGVQVRRGVDHRAGGYGPGAQPPVTGTTDSPLVK